jgi:hypothetical protein
MSHANWPTVCVVTRLNDSLVHLRVPLHLPPVAVRHYRNFAGTVRPAAHLALAPSKSHTCNRPMKLSWVIDWNHT